MREWDSVRTLDLSLSDICVVFRSIVEDCRDKFLAAVPDSERSGLRWEHIGSTSIKGMPGTKFPDALLVIPEFPPSKGVIQAFLDSGYYFHGSSALDVRDLWWMLVFSDGRNSFKYSFVLKYFSKES